MPINLRALSLTLLLAGIISTPALAEPNGAVELLNSAKKWEQKNRPDRAKTVLLKLILIEPNSEEGLFMLGKLELQHGKASEALRYLHSLEQVAPNGQRTRELGKTYRDNVGDPNPPEKTAAPLNAKSGETDESRFQVKNASKSEFLRVQNELSSLYQQSGDTRYRLMLLELQSSRRDSLTASVAGYEELSATPGVNTRRLQSGWRHSLRKLPDNANKQNAIKHLLAVYPDDQEMISLLAEVQKNSAVRSVVASQKFITAKNTKLAKKSATKKTDSTPAAEAAISEANRASNPDIVARTAALDALDDGDLELAQTGLLDVLKRRPQDPEVLGGLGFVKLRQGKHEEAEQWFTQASTAAKGESARWKGLVITAGFWKHMREAGDLLEANKLAEAENAAGQALALQAGEPNALALLGNIKAAENDQVEAERLYRDALKKEGFNLSAIRGLTSLLIRAQRNTEAMELIEQVQKDFPDDLNKNPSAQAGLLREESELYIAAHRPSHAIQSLEMAVLLDPKEPWTRFSLAKLYLAVGLTPLGKQIMKEGADLSPNDPNMHYARALLLLSMDDYAAGLESLSKIPEEALTTPMRDTRNRAQMQNYFHLAEIQLAGGNRKEAIRIMAVAETQARGNYPATEQVAEGWFRLGLPKQGLSAMRKLPQPLPLATQVYYASLLNRAKKDQELAIYLPGLHIPDGTDDTTLKYKSTIQDIEFAMAGRQFDKLNKEGKTEQANQFAQTILSANSLNNADYFRFHRKYFSTTELPDNAIELLSQEKEQYPNDLNIRWDLAYAYYQNKQNSNAQKEIQELLGLTRGDDIDARLRIASLQQNTGDHPGAHQTLNDLLSRFPHNTDVLLQAGNLARADGKYNEAMHYYQQTKSQTAAPDAPADAKTPDILLNLLPAPTGEATRITKPAAPASTKESEQVYRAAIAAETGAEKYVASSAAARADQEMSSIKAARPPFIVEAGLDIQMKNASSGMSTYNATEIPLLTRFPIGYQAKGMVQVDKVDIDAGALPANFADASQFGKIQPAQTGLAQPLAQTASGTSVAIAYEQDAFKADIGVVGMGFLVSNVVGGLRTGGDIGRMSYSLNLSRRPYTGSMLSYAGARDPVSGAVWGGVTNTGISLYMSTTLSSLNVAAMGSYGLLRGQNVLNNDRLFLRTTVDYDLYTSDDMVFNIGVNANYMSFAQNESFYTFGQGGYYSPQSSITLGLPVSVYGRSNLLSYQLTASASYSVTKENSALYFPTDPALQANASAGPKFAAYYNQAIYTGSSNGGGFGYGLRGLAEYRATPNLALGGRFSIDRSAYYAPNALMMYMKYMFTPEKGPIKLKPEPVIPYSQF